MITRAAKRSRGAAVKGNGTGGQEPAVGASQGNQNGAGPVAEHPLLNQVVLKRIFEYIQPTANLDTLKCTRLVCSTWRNESLNLWRKNAVLKLVPERGLMEEPSTGGGINPPELLKEMQDPSGPYALLEKPFEKYKLEGMIISIPFALKEGSPSNLFWNVVGPQVKHLILDRVNFTGIEEEKQFNSDLLQFLLKHVPNLEHLELRNISVNGQKCNPSTTSGEVFYEDEEDMPRKMTFRPAELIHPRVLSLTVDEFTGFQVVNFPNLRHIVRKMEEDPDSLLDLLLLSRTGPLTNSSVKTLDLMESPIGLDTDVSMLDRIQFSCLQRISICFKDCYSSREFQCPVLGKILQAQSGTLQVLEVCCSFLLFVDNRFPFGGQMEALKELRLWGNVTNDLGFLRWMPNLQVLMMDLRGLDKKEYLQNVLEEDIESRPSVYFYEMCDVSISESELMEVELLNLEIVHINHKFTLEQLGKLGEYMPNVKVLKTILGSGSIDVICETWPLLEKLVGLHGSLVSDKDMIGKIGKGLVDLKHLKSFHLNANCNEGQLTDVAVSGFLKMTELTDLQVCVSPKFSKKAQLRLEDRFQNVKIIRNYSRNRSHVDWECCRNKEYLTYLKEVTGFEEEDEEDDEEEGEDDDDVRLGQL